MTKLAVAPPDASSPISRAYDFGHLIGDVFGAWDLVRVGGSVDPCPHEQGFPELPGLGVWGRRGPSGACMAVYTESEGRGVGSENATFGELRLVAAREGEALIALIAVIRSWRADCRVVGIKGWGCLDRRVPSIFAAANLVYRFRPAPSERAISTSPLLRGGR